MTPRIGLVFDGGGAKGAYQIGIWKALHELGLDKYVTAVAGTSVGGLNAALFTQGDLESAYEKAYFIWTNEINKISPARIQMDLNKLIEKYIDEYAFSSSKIDCYLSVFHPGQRGEYCETDINGKQIEKYVNNEMTYYNLRCISQKQCHILFESCSTPKAILLATSAIPILCPPVSIEDDLSCDGGVGNNSPVYPLSWHTSKCDIIIVIHLSLFKDSINKKMYPGLNIHEIIPNIPQDKLGLLNGTLKFDLNYANYMLEAGYRDSIEQLSQLAQNYVSANSEAFTDMKLKLLSEEDKTKQNKRLQRLSALIDYHKGK